MQDSFCQFLVLELKKKEYFFYQFVSVIKKKDIIIDLFIIYVKILKEN